MADIISGGSSGSPGCDKGNDNPTETQKKKGSNGQLNSCKISEISLKDFLDFITIAYRVNSALEHFPLDALNKFSSFDWSQLTTNKLVSGVINHGTSFKHRVSEKIVSKDLTVLNGSKREKSPPHTSKSLEICCSEKHDDQEDKSFSKSGLKICDKQNNRPRGRSASIVGNTCGVSNNRCTDKIKQEKYKNNVKRDGSESRGKSQSDYIIAEYIVKRKLSEVLQEGILDSVLPYVLPKQNCGTSVLKKSVTILETKKSSPEKQLSSTLYQSKDNVPNYHPKKQNCSVSDSAKDFTKDVEVEIHVCDEVKNMKKDFRCSQKLLVSKMGYFAEVTTGQKLEDMDISVHCDITVFDWLMRWVKKDLSRPEVAPTLDATNVIPVLVSAAFLQMDPLLNDCLRYCREHMNDILRLATNLSCLNDSIITRLANQFTNTEIEAMRDKKDKLQSRLFCKLIFSLAEPEPDHKRGHFASVAHIFKCIHCGKLLPKGLCSRIPCKPAYNRLDPVGNIQGIHAREPEWSLTDYIKHVRNEVKCWRRVYWRLWGICHFLYCNSCYMHYPVYQTDWCCYHSDSPQFFTMEQHRSMSFPIGRYPCCGERAYRFELLQNPNGCAFKTHSPVLESHISLAVHSIFQTYRSSIAVEPPQIVLRERLTRLVRSNRENIRNEDKECIMNSSLWWHGLELASPKPKSSLVSRIWEKCKTRENLTDIYGKPLNKRYFANAGSVSYVEASGSSDNTSSSPDLTERDSSSPSLGEDNSESSIQCSVPVRKLRKKKQSLMLMYCPSQPNQWLSRYSTRYNQDNQRDYEEWSLRTIITMLSRRHGDSYNRSSSRGKFLQWNPYSIPLGIVLWPLYVTLQGWPCTGNNCTVEESCTIIKLLTPPSTPNMGYSVAQ